MKEHRGDVTLEWYSRAWYYLLGALSLSLLVIFVGTFVAIFTIPLSGPHSIVSDRHLEREQ